MAALVILLLSAASARAADDLRATGRATGEKLGDAIVTVKAVLSIKVSMEGNERPESEEKSVANGTVIAPDGTTIVPLSAIDPSIMIKRSMPPEYSQQLSIDCRVKDLKLVVNKRTEIDATVVQRDPDLDLAILRPVKKPEKPMTAVDLADSVAPRLLEEVFVLARMGRVADYEIGVMTGEVQSIVTKPRTFYIPSGELASGGEGVPIFTGAGKLVGFVLSRVAPGGDESTSFSMGGDGSSIGIILPSADVQEIVAQIKPTE
jgi:S1-C subfamily serine protease